MANIRKIEGKTGVSYKITVSTGYLSKGKQKRYYKTWVPAAGMTDRQIEKELQRQAVLFEEKCHAGAVADSNIKFKAFSEQWFREYAEVKLKTRTIDLYHQFEARAYKALGHLRMNEISTRTVQLFISNLQEDGINERTQKALAPKTVKNYLSFISTIFDYAVSQGVARSNPCHGVTLPAMVKVERNVYTLEEAQQFLELLGHEPMQWRVFFTLAVYGGFRRGERFGFEWKDINFDTAVITVNRTSNYTPERGVFTDTPKTKGSQRSLMLPVGVMQLLKQYRAEQAAERLRLGSQWVNSDRLFTSWNGAAIHPSSAKNWLDRFCERTGMHKVNIHSFRHLNASLLINSGADVKTVSAVLGHAQTSTTLNIYAHTFAEAQAKAVGAVADALNLDKNKVISAK
ncbi:tyrosine recombinase XerC [Anaerotruncus rubiinfantis]